MDRGMAAVLIRAEEPADAAAVRAVNELAFEQPIEADLVDALRAAGKAVVALVAVAGGRVVGHILFSEVRIEPDAGGAAAVAAGLAPMAVLPELQRRGIGSRLVEAGLARCREAGYGASIVLGHPDYYPRFGYVPASRFGVRSTYDVPDEVFMAQELRPGALAAAAGLARYAPEFDAAGE